MNIDQVLHLYFLADEAEACARDAQSCVSHVTAEEHIIRHLQNMRELKRISLARRASTLLLPPEDK